MRNVMKMFKYFNHKKGWKAEQSRIDMTLGSNVSEKDLKIFILFRNISYHIENP